MAASIAAMGDENLREADILLSFLRPRCGRAYGTGSSEVTSLPFLRSTPGDIGLPS